MPKKFRHKHQLYQHIYEQIPAIMNDARKAGEKLGLSKVKDTIGLYSGASSCPARLPDYVLDEIIAANKIEILPLRAVEDQFRDLVKDFYGDKYDCAIANTCEGALRIVYDTLFSPPTMRKGDAYRARVLTPYGEDIEWGAGYGRAFPPRYKNVAVERSVTAGELGVEGKSLTNLDSLLVKYAGTKYEIHGVKQSVVPLMTRTDVNETLSRIEKMCNRHAYSLTGFSIVGYDTPGYGYGDHDSNGIPKLMKGIGKIAAEYDLPFLVDSASCLPIVGLSPEEIGADVMVWSMDKAGRSPIAGLIVGHEENMVYIRKALGLSGQRYGEVSSHGKAAYSICDPGRDSTVGLLAFLKVLHDNPGIVLRPIDQLHDIIVEEFSTLKQSRLREKLIITKSYHMGGTELNYEQTWDDENFGIPIFGLEDLNANTNAISLATEAMGVSPSTIYSGNMFLGPGLGTLDSKGELNAEYARLAAKALVKSVEIVCEHAGIGE